jgi:hypothetical protein
VIVTAVRWYCRFRLSLADVGDLLAERGIEVSPRTILSWVQKFGPLLAAPGHRARKRWGSVYLRGLLPPGERKYHLTNHPAGTPLRVLVAAIKARWVCEQAHLHSRWSWASTTSRAAPGPA